MSVAEIIAELPRLNRAELVEVQAKVRELVGPAAGDAQERPVATHPALGIWKDRADLPADPVEASRTLRDRMMPDRRGRIVTPGLIDSSVLIDCLRGRENVAIRRSLDSLGS